MKYLIGFLAIALILFAATFFMLRLWGIEMLSPEYTTKLLYSLGIIVVTAFILIVAIILPFFNHNTKGYNRNGDGIAQKKL
ncbi:hypothetical protein ACK1KB_07660 [Chryseobacterium sp. TY3]